MSSCWAQIRDYLHLCKEIIGGIVQLWVGFSNGGWGCPIMGGIVQLWVGLSNGGWDSPGGQNQERGRNYYW